MIWGWTHRESKIVCVHMATESRELSIALVGMEAFVSATIVNIICWRLSTFVYLKYAVPSASFAVSCVSGPSATSVTLHSIPQGKVQSDDTWTTSSANLQLAPTDFITDAITDAISNWVPDTIDGATCCWIGRGHCCECTRAHRDALQHHTH